METITERMVQADGSFEADRARPYAPPTQTEALSVADEDRQRASIYALLSRCLAQPLDAQTLEMVRSLEGDKSTDLGASLATFAELARRTTEGAAEDEYSLLFYGMGAGGEVTPHASFYLTGLLNSRPLADLRRDLDAIGIEKNPSMSEPEDHLAFICEVMFGLITGEFGEPASVADQRTFFEKHLAPWAPLFFQDLEKAKSAVFYMPLATVGRHFMDIEAAAFDMDREAADG